VLSGYCYKNQIRVEIGQVALQLTSGSGLQLDRARVCSNPNQTQSDLDLLEGCGLEKKMTTSLMMNEVRGNGHEVSEANDDRQRQQ